MPQKGETITEIFESSNQEKFYRRPLFGKWSFLISIIFAILAGFIAGYLAASTWLNNQDEIKIIKNDNRQINFTQPIKINNPNNDLIQHLNDKMVGIYAVSNNDKWWEKLGSTGNFLGNGLIITSDGWIITTDQTINDFKKNYQVMAVNKKVYPANNLFKDNLTGLVYLKIDAQNLSTIQFANNNALSQAEEVIVMSSLASGVNPRVKLSNLEQLNYFLTAVPKDYFHSTEKQDQYYLLKDPLTIDYQNGLVANLSGDIVGMIKINKDQENLPLAIPGDYLNQSVNMFLKDRNKLKHNYLGLTYLDLSQGLGLPENLTTGRTKGVLLIDNKELTIIATNKNSPAYKKLISGDIITGVDGFEINELNNFTKLIQDYQPGSKILFDIIRKGNVQTVEITLK